MRLSSVLVAFLLPVTASAANPAPAEADVGYGVCASCHGVRGEGRAEMGGPRIGGLDAAYVESQLLAFREGRRSGHEGDRAGWPMVAIAQGLDEAAIPKLATHVAALTPPPVAPAEPVEGGEEAWAPCGACHGEDATGMAALKAPALHSQDPDYLARQLANYRSGARGGAGSDPLAMQMAATAVTLSDEDVSLLLAHVASLRPEVPPLPEPEITKTPREGLDAWADIYSVASHPRCANCHPAGDAPLQTDASTPHVLGVTRFSPLQGVHCRTCHPSAATSDGLAPLPPADPMWALAPREMAFEGRTSAELCAQLTDPATNGHRSLEDLVSHIEEDHLLKTSWFSGRTPPPVTHAELVERVKVWVAAGGPCPE